MRREAALLSEQSAKMDPVTSEVLVQERTVINRDDFTQETVREYGDSKILQSSHVVTRDNSGVISDTTETPVYDAKGVMVSCKMKDSGGSVSGTYTVWTNWVSNDLQELVMYNEDGKPVRKLEKKYKNGKQTGETLWVYADGGFNIAFEQKFDDMGSLGFEKSYLYPGKETDIAEEYRYENHYENGLLKSSSISYTVSSGKQRLSGEYTARYEYTYDAAGNVSTRKQYRESKDVEAFLYETVYYTYRSDAGK